MAWLQKCDMCGKIYERGIEAANRVRYRVGRVGIEIVIGVSEDEMGAVVWNKGHVCHKCLAKILRNVADLLEIKPEDVREVVI